MSRYGLPSRRMLTFLNENPGSTSGQIKKHLHGDKTISQVKVQYEYTTYYGDIESRTMWTSRSYVEKWMMKPDGRYTSVHILDERNRLLSQVCRGKFAYLLSPMYNRTLAADPEGRRHHPGTAPSNRNGQRKWFYRVKGTDGRFRYFLTLIGMAALEEHGAD